MDELLFGIRTVCPLKLIILFSSSMQESVHLATPNGNWG